MKLRWVFREFIAPFRGLFLVTAILSVLASAIPAFQPLLSSLVVNQVVTRELGAELWWLTALVVITFAVPPILSTCSQQVQAKLGDRILRRMDQRIIGAGAAMPDLAAIERPEIHDAIGLVTHRLWPWEMIPRNLLLAAAQAIGVLIVLISLATLDWWIPLLLLAAAIPHIIGEQRMAAVRFGTLRDQARTAREMDYCLTAASDPRLAKEVRAFGLGEFFLRRFDLRSRPAVREMAGVRIRSVRMSGLGMLGYGVAVVLTFGWVGREALDGHLSAGAVALYLTGIISLFTSLFQFAITLGGVVEMIKSLDALIAVTDNAKPGIAIAAHPQEMTPRIASEIRLEGVTFGYPSAGEDVAPTLRGVDLTIPAGSVLAIVGENGEGKSTLVKLLTRMYDPQQGRITIDGTDVSAFDLDSLRRRIATIYQDHARFSFTLEENIAFGDPHLLDADQPAAERREKVLAAAVKGGADTVVEELPNHLDTELTRRFGGVDLSGGQWQRVATARAFIPDAGLIILDEATSALDVDAERRLFDSFAELVRGRTAVMISHRFSTVRTADVIAVLDGGRIAEYGTHEELLARGGRYAELFTLQASRYE